MVVLRDAVEFRINAKHVLLTYPQANDAGFTKETLRVFLLDIAPVQHSTICKENHAEEDGVHYHAFITFQRKFSTRDGRRFDFLGHHPNIDTRIRSIKQTLQYLKKDGDFITDHPDPAAKPDWGSIIRDSTTTDEALQSIQLWYPRDFLLYNNRFRESLDSIYRPADPAYQTPQGVRFQEPLPPVLAHWIDNEVCSLETLSTITFIFEHTVQ